MNKYLATGIALILVAFAAGRASVMKDTTKSTTIDQEEQKSKNTHTQTTTTTIKAPNGEVKTVTTTDTVSNTEITKKEVVTKNEQVVSKNKTLNVSALISVSNIMDRPNYGISVSKEVMGPITAGVWGLNNGMLGLSVGINF